MILTITPAPALDATTRMPLFELGESLRVDLLALRAGGKGLNVARVLDSRGIPVRALGPLGGDTGRSVAAELAATTGVEQRFITVAAPTRTCQAFVEDSGRTTVLNERAGALSAAEWQRFDEAVLGSLPGVTAAAVSGSWPTGAGAERMGSLVATLVTAGIYTVADTSGPALLAAAAAGAHLLKPNVAELAEATGTPDVGEGLAALFAAGAGAVLLSRGEEGLSFHTPANPAGRHARLDAVLSGNPTGAGDASVAGWLSVVGASGEQPEGAALDAALRTAVAWSASAVKAPLAGELGPEADAFLRRVVLTGP